jgi:AraC-like DNA-binding protein
MDALTDVLRTVHLKGSVYCRSELTAPWGMEIPAADVAQFHVVRRGGCWLTMDLPSGPATRRLGAGDLALLPRGTAHVLRDDPGSRAVPLGRLLANREQNQPSSPLRHGGGGAPTTLICGCFSFDASTVHPMLSVLPPIVVASSADGRPHPWLESTLDLIDEEASADRPGAETLVDRLTEAMFVLAVRAHLASEQGMAASWLAGLRDGRIAGALALMHRSPADRWTLERLAGGVGMSRSAFFGRFRELVGEPPMQYLTRWRMQLAARHLGDPLLSLPEIAARVGYRADASFSRVFKRHWGVPPAAYRRGPPAASGS